MVAPIRVSLVGMGAMGKRHARVFGAMPHAVSVVGAFDIDRALEGWPAGLPRFSDEREAVRAADLVVVATPAGAHADAIVRALEAGRHVFVEKPLCTDARTARALVALAEERDRKLLVGHSERFNPVIRALMGSLKARNERVVSFKAERRGPSRVEDVGVLLNFGVHDLDIAERLAGEPVSLTASTGRRDLTTGLDRIAELRLSWGSGNRGDVVVERTDTIRRRRVEVVTDQATYAGDMLAARLVRRTADGEEIIPLSGMREPLAYQAEAVGDALTSGRGDVAAAEEAARAVELAVEAALRIPSVSLGPSRGALPPDRARVSIH